MTKPRIAILMDENTSGDGRRYEAGKGYFEAIANAGGLPFGVPYHSEIISSVVADFDGLMTAGGRFDYPDDWYVDVDGAVRSKPSDRFDVEKQLTEDYLARDKPILGICAGMQMLACLHGCKLTPSLKLSFPDAIEHDGSAVLHDITIRPGSKLETCIGAAPLVVNSFHREAIATLSAPVVACAHASDGVIEAIELPGQTFALGLQWHQERFAGSPHRGNRLFESFVGSC